ncbi:protein TPR3-like [Castanea sativa]|uniref:protein TPR3-like n=1 Tax=Castanea sativa TaxID=21020 RepID=UPI003F6510C9
MAAGNLNIDLNSNANRELLYMITQFLEHENLTETARTLERESGFYFNMRFFEDLVHNGAFDEAEEYVDGFTDLHENSFSTKIYFELRKQKFLETLEDGKRCKALTMLMQEFRDFAPYSRSLCSEAAALLTVDDFRTHQALAGYGEVNEARRSAMDDIRRCIQMNPVFQGKLQPPNIESTLQGAIMYGNSANQNEQQNGDGGNGDPAPPPNDDVSSPGRN